MMGRGPHWARCFQDDGYQVTVLGEVSAQLLASNRFHVKRIKATIQETLGSVDRAYFWPVAPFARFRWSRRITAFVFERLCLPYFMVDRTDRESVIWLFRPADRFDFRKYPHRRLVLDVADDSAGTLSNVTVKEEIRQVEEHQARQVDVVFASAVSLFERFRKYNPNTFLVRNGVDYEFFTCPIDPVALPSAIHAMIELCKDRPVVGYQGAISDWFDFDLMERLIQRFPDYAFVFLGPISLHVEALFRQKIGCYSNAFYWGMQPYQWMPYLLRQFDLGLIPFVVRDFTVAVNPLKLYEYLACEIPVVSVDLPEVARNNEAETVTTAHSSDDFGDAVESMITSRQNPKVRERCREIAVANSWETRYQEIKRHIG